MIGRNGERGSGISALAVRHDDDDDDIYIYYPKPREPIVGMILLQDFLFSNVHINQNSIKSSM